MPTYDIIDLVEHREWGDKGELLPDLQAKLNTYLAFVMDGQLAQQYPAMNGKKIRFRLHKKGVAANRRPVPQWRDRDGSGNLSVTIDRDCSRPGVSGGGRYIRR